MDKYGLLYARYEVSDRWYTDSSGKVTWDKSRILPLVDGRPILSGHAIILNGYDISDKTKTMGRNTWSRLWAKNGDFFAFHEDYPITEAWAVTLTSQVPNIPTGPKVEESTWKKLLTILRSLSIIK